MTTLREAAEMALGTLQDVCARLLYRGVSKDAGHPDQIALEQARQTIQALKQATEQSKQKRDPIAWNGWIVREVLFDEGEPVGHRAPPQPVAQPEPEPVAWMIYTLDGASVCVTDSPSDFTSEYRALPIYTHPPQRKPLTDDDLEPLRIRIMGEAYNAADEGQSEEYNAIKVLCAVLLDLVKRAVTSLDTANSKEAQLDYIAQQIKSVVSSFNISKSLPVADTESDVLTATYMLGVHAGKKVANRKPLTDEEIDQLSRTMVKGGKSVNWLCRAIERAHGIA